MKLRVLDKFRWVLTTQLLEGSLSTLMTRNRLSLSPENCRRQSSTAVADFSALFSFMKSGLEQPA